MFAFTDREAVARLQQLDNDVQQYARKIQELEEKVCGGAQHQHSLSNNHSWCLHIVLWF